MASREDRRMHPVGQHVIRLGRGAAVLVGVAVALGACTGSGGADPAQPTTAGAAVSAPAASAPVVASVAASLPETTVDDTPPATNAPVSAVITTTTVKPGAPVACTLLTTDELRFVGGEGVVFDAGNGSEPQETPYGAHTSCTWTATKGADATVRVSVWDDASAFDAARVQVGATGDIPDVGQQAFSSTLSSVYAVANGHTVFVQFQDLDRDDAANLAASTGLAKLVASRL